TAKAPALVMVALHLSFAPAVITGTRTRHSSRSSSYCTSVRTWLAAATSDDGSVKVSEALEPSGACGTSAPAESRTASSAEASGDQPSGRRPASDCAPTAVSAAFDPDGTAPAGSVAST